MEDKVYQGFLYDFYGELLSEHRRSIYESYINDDMSLSEIAAECNITRQGVHDVIKRSTKALMDYESKLHLVEKFLKIRDDVVEINELTNNLSQESIDRIKELATGIIEEL